MEILGNPNKTPAADTLVLSEFSRINPGAFRNYLYNVRLRKTAFTPTAAFSASSSGDPPGKRSPSQLVKKFASHSDRDLYFETSAAATDFLSRKEGQMFPGNIMHIMAINSPSDL